MRLLSSRSTLRNVVIASRPGSRAGIEQEKLNESSLVRPWRDRAFGGMQHCCAITAATTSSASRVRTAASGDADVSGRDGDPGERQLPASAAAPGPSAATSAW